MLQYLNLSITFDWLDGFSKFKNSHKALDMEKRPLRGQGPPCTAGVAGAVVTPLHVHVTKQISGFLLENIPIFSLEKHEKF